jgi:extracellular factor (EF) 3-hydroxypalmitic acid methyl ester biosynthesis protein
MGVVASGRGTGLGVVSTAEVFAESRGERLRVWDVLDAACELISDQRVPEGMTLLANELLALKMRESADSWEAICRSVVEQHPIGPVLWRDPFTAHSYRKPKGYAGDAQLLDYLYGLTPPPSGTAPEGVAVFDYMMRQQGALSVRARRELLARLIDQTADEFPAPRVLSIACGHLREAGLSRAVAEGRIGEFLALDQDPESLSEIRRSLGDRVQTVNESVRSILGGKLPLRDFHLVYAAGLYDYLSDRVAARLTRILFDMLAPGGRLVVANFAPTLPEMGYMESFMGWKLIYRTPEEMAQVGSEIHDHEWTSRRMFWDEPGNVVYLELVKRGSPMRMEFVRQRPTAQPPEPSDLSLHLTPSGRRGRRRDAVSSGEATGQS